MESPHRSVTDSPSRQLLLELGRLSIAQEQEHRDTLDKHAELLENEYRQSLAAADEKRRRIREHAVVVLEKYELEARLAAEQQIQDEERELIKLRRERAEREATRERERAEAEQAAEAAEREAHEQRQRAEQARIDRQRREEESRQAAQKQAEEEKAAKAEAEEKARAAAVQALQQRQQSHPQPQQTPKPTLAASTPTPASSTVPPSSAPSFTAQSSTPAPATQATPGLQQREAEHSRYIGIHSNLKKLRAFMKEHVKSNPAIKNTMSDGRRTIQKCVSQLVVGDAASNRRPQSDILNVLRSALQFPHPQVNVTDYILDPPPGVPDTQGPGLLLYFFNILAKALLRQYLGEAAIKPKAADPVGVLGSSMFAQLDLLWHGVSLIDILIAKFHVTCPVLFGIYGSDRTTAGKERLGWRVDPSTGVLATQQRHYERMTGLGAGFASIALRNFDKSKCTNPYPPWHYWRALADIVNTPSEMITDTHLVVLKAMIDGSEQRVLDFFGNAGRAALRVAVIDFPRRKQGDSMAGKALMLLPELWRKEMNFYV